MNRNSWKDEFTILDFETRRGARPSQKSLLAGTPRGDIAKPVPLGAIVRRFLFVLALGACFWGWIARMVRHVARHVA